MILKLLSKDDPLLRTHSCAVADPTSDDVKNLSLDMIATMRSVRGIGLAAVQVGSPMRMFVVEHGASKKVLVAVNPTVLDSSGMQTCDEGCLSMPGQFRLVERAKRIALQYTDLNGKKHVREFSNLGASIVLHEMDHLNGVLITDRSNA
jgi:peptide deformylase